MFLTPSSIINFKSFRTEKVEWLRFAKIVSLILCIPLGILLLLCEILCWKSGELVSDQAATQRQIADPRLIWMAHHEIDAVHFKLLRVNQVRPEILVMGQSRAAHFRAAMFQPYSFYNLARVSWPLNTLPLVLQHLPPGYTPRVIIFSLDFFVFNSVYGASHAKAAPRFDLPFLKGHLDSLRDALTALSANPFVFFFNTPLPTLGMHARLTQHGFRVDGSETLPLDLEKIAGRNPNMIEEADWKGEPLFGGAATMGKNEESDLEKFVRMAKARGIQLIGIEMPVYRPMVQAIENNPHFGILQDFRAHISSGYFDRLGIITFDYLDFPPYSDDYRYFVDPFHSTEPVSAAVLLKIDQDPRVQALLPKLNRAALQLMLEKDRMAAQHVDLY